MWFSQELTQSRWWHPGELRRWMPPFWTIQDLTQFSKNLMQSKMAVFGRPAMVSLLSLPHYTIWELHIWSSLRKSYQMASVPDQQGKQTHLSPFIPKVTADHETMRRLCDISWEFAALDSLISLFMRYLFPPPNSAEFLQVLTDIHLLTH